MIPVELTTERLVLNQPEARDRDLIAEYCSDPLFERFMTTPWPYELKHADYFITEYVPIGWSTDAEFTWALRRAADGPLLGVIGYRIARGDVGYWLGAPHRGSALMSEAVDAVTEWLFARGIPVVLWECIEGNVASAGVARRSGYTYTRTGPSDLGLREGMHPVSWHAERRPGPPVPSEWPTWPPQGHDGDIRQA